MKLWETAEHSEEKGSTEALRKLTEAYTVGDDFIYDKVLLPWDCAASLAHATMLTSLQVLSSEDLHALRQGLTSVLNQALEGRFLISLADEDGHTAIENYLVKHHGEAGEKIHTARSRNDQVLVALRLYIKNGLFLLEERTLDLARTFTECAEKHPVAWPGYTHQQPAMPSTVALWAHAFAESMYENARHLSSLRELLDTSPLGAAAGYGVALPIDREMTASLLGFASVQNNVIAVQNSRGKHEALVISALMGVMGDLSKLATDLIFFSLPEVGYLTLPEACCTGSSIMPHKRNPDVCELTRAKAKQVAAHAAFVWNLTLDLPSGYNRDFQLAKRPLIESCSTTLEALEIMNAIVPLIVVHRERCEGAITPDILATDVVYEQVRAGIPFRQAYRAVKKGIANLSVKDPYSYLTAKTHTGAPGALSIPETLSLISSLQSERNDSYESFLATIERLLPEVRQAASRISPKLW